MSHSVAIIMERRKYQLRILGLGKVGLNQVSFLCFLSIPFDFYWRNDKYYENGKAIRTINTQLILGVTVSY
jgi:hypothetical protein